MFDGESSSESPKSSAPPLVGQPQVPKNGFEGEMFAGGQASKVGTAGVLVQLWMAWFFASGSSPDSVTEVGGCEQ